MATATLRGQIVRPNGVGQPGVLFRLESVTSADASAGIVGQIDIYGDANGNYSAIVNADAGRIYRVVAAIAGLFDPFYINAPAPDSVIDVMAIAPIAPPVVVPAKLSIQDTAPLNPAVGDVWI